MGHPSIGASTLRSRPWLLLLLDRTPISVLRGLSFSWLTTLQFAIDKIWIPSRNETWQWKIPIPQKRGLNGNINKRIHHYRTGRFELQTQSRLVWYVVILLVRTYGDFRFDLTCNHTILGTRLIDWGFQDPGLAASRTGMELTLVCLEDTWIPLDAFCLFATFYTFACANSNKHASLEKLVFHDISGLLYLFPAKKGLHNRGRDRRWGSLWWGPLTKWTN